MKTATTEVGLLILKAWLLPASSNNAAAALIPPLTPGPVLTPKDRIAVK